MIAKCLGYAALAIGGLLLGVGPAGADESPGRAMTSEEMRAYHSGRELSGCYVDQPQDPEWRERMAEDGRLFDLEQGGREVGTWWIEEGGVICFRYTDRLPGPHCFTGRRRGAYYDFYTRETGQLLTTTQCGDDPIA